MHYPTGFARHVLWGCILFLCVGLAAGYKGNGLVMDWLIISAALVWHIVATKPIRRGGDDDNDGLL